MTNELTPFEKIERLLTRIKINDKGQNNVIINFTKDQKGRMEELRKTIQEEYPNINFEEEFKKCPSFAHHKRVEYVKHVSERIYTKDEE